MEDIKYIGISEEDSRRLNDIRRRIESGEEVQIEGIRVPQRKYPLEEFRRGSNNFYMHFVMEDGYFPRNRSHFKRFQKAHPELEAELTKECRQCRAEHRGWENLPWEKLHHAYDLMAEFVECHYDDLRKNPDGEFVPYDNTTRLGL